MDKQNLVILVSGGRSSALMARHIQTSPKYDNYNKLYLFCNTGMERPETILFLKEMVKHWQLPLILIEGVYSNETGIGVKSKQVTFGNLDMSGSTFSAMIAQVNKHKYVGLPNTAVPYCSDYLKTRVSHDFARIYFNSTKYIKALGYRLEDMPKRITLIELRHDKTRIAPLLTDFDKPVDNLYLNKYFDKNTFKLNIHSELGNCELCWKKSTKTLIKSIHHGTRFVNWTIDHEKKYNNTMYRSNKSITDILQLANSGVQTSLFDDVNDQCVCSF